MLTWPTDIIAWRCEFYLQANTRVFRSPMTRSRQVLAGQGRMWIGQYSFRLARAKAQRLDVLLDQAKGQVESFGMWDHARRGLLGAGLDPSTLADTFFADAGSPSLTTFSDGGSPLGFTFFGDDAAGYIVAGGYDVGDETVMVRGFRQNAVADFLAGDYIGLGGFLYGVLEDSAADELGRATLTLNRPLLTALEYGDVVTITRPTTPMQLIDDDQPSRGVAVDGVYEYTLGLVEVLNT